MYVFVRCSVVIRFSFTAVVRQRGSRLVVLFFFYLFLISFERFLLQLLVSLFVLLPLVAFDKRRLILSSNAMQQCNIYSCNRIEYKGV